MNQQKSVKDFIKTSFGNIIEWYDFSLYGIFAVSIAKSFFPNYSQFMALLMTFLTFSVSFIARPIGSIIFGSLGDKMGKRYSVNLSIWCMAIPTVMIGILPSHQQIGYLAPLILIILRFIQGISVGGQFSGLITIAVENTDTKRSYFVSLILMMSMIGSLSASVVGLLFYEVFDFFSVASLSWRPPFILSGILFMIYLKLNPQIEKENIKSDYKLKDIFKQQKYEVIYLTAFSAALGSLYYILYSYSVTFLSVHLNLKGSTPLVIINFLFIVSLICYFIFGKLADKSSNRIKACKIMSLMLGIMAVLLSCKTELVWVVSCFTGLVILYTSIAAYTTSMFAELFDSKYRMTACSLCYSGGAVVGGFSPSIAELVTKGSPSGFYMLLLCIGFILYLLLDNLQETSGYQKFIVSNDESFNLVYKEGANNV